MIVVWFVMQYGVLCVVYRYCIVWLLVVCKCMVCVGYYMHTYVVVQCFL